MKFSESTGCFYPDDINYGSYPEDAVDVTEDQFAEAMRNPPKPTPPSEDQLAAGARSQRNTLLQQTDWSVVFALESGTAIPDAMKTYRQALRDVPAQKGFPAKIKWPTAPSN